MLVVSHLAYYQVIPFCLVTNEDSERLRVVTTRSVVLARRDREADLVCGGTDPILQERKKDFINDFQVEEEHTKIPTRRRRWKGIAQQQHRQEARRIVSVWPSRALFFC